MVHRIVLTVPPLPRSLLGFGRAEVRIRDARRYWVPQQVEVLAKNLQRSLQKFADMTG